MIRTGNFIVIPSLLALLIILSAPILQAYESNIVKGFKVEGNRLIKEDVILLNLKMKVGDRLENDKIQEEIARLGEMGYFSYVGADVKSSDTGKEVVFKVEENAIIGEIEVKGNAHVSTDKIRGAMESKTGTVFNSKLLTQDIQGINDLLSREGFMFSKVTDASVKDKGRSIFVEITEGKLADIKIEGLKKTKEYVVRRELSIKPGDIYDNNKIVRDLQRIYNLGFFEEVKRDHLPGKNPEDVTLVIQIVEQKTGRAGVGGGYSSLNGLVGFANLSQNNYKGEGKRLSLKTEFGGVKTYEVGYFDPWFGGKPRSLGVDLYNTKYTRNLYTGGNTLTEYDEERKGGTLTLGKRIRRDVDLSFHFRDEDVKLKPTDSTASIPVGIVNGRLQSFGGVLDKDTRDNRFRPTTGLHDSLSIETTGGILKGANEYTKFMLALRRYIPISKGGKTVFAVQGVTGRTDIGKGFVPVYDMFSVGGSDSIRGYREREFLGTKLLYGNFEIRQRLAKNFDVVVFYDAGDVWGLDYDQTARDFKAKSGYGLGLRLQTPLGPVAIDHGKAADRSDGRTYFNFGSSF
ncbi:MAG: BamA/TamA family outer membrane protein [Candidatus Riflebacteria bacterium]|nr:BamA/TamA family outer membrane protein [Candidatus Riflebacteria bacterium]